MKPIRCIIFDLDGTLIDTEPSAARAVERGFSSWGLTVSEEDSKFVTGRTWKSAFDYLFAKFPPPLPRLDAEKLILELYRQSLEKELTIVPGSVAAVQALSSHFELALVSGSHRQEVLWALNKLGILGHFKAVFGAEDYPKSKPAPDGFLAAMKKLGADGESTLIFEDSNAGIQSARAAGAWVVAITGTNHFRQDTSQAHQHIQDLTTVTAEWVKTFRARES